MILCDTNDVIYVDSGEELDERMVHSIHVSGNKFTAVGDILFRQQEDGSVTLFYVGQKPFTRVHLSPAEVLLFQRHKELYTETAHMYHYTNELTHVLTDTVSFNIPTEMIASAELR